jgi:hypothetical protein
VADLVLTNGTRVTVSVPSPRITMSPPTSSVAVVPVTGPVGPAGPAGTDPDLADLSLIFENGLI